MTSMKSMSKSKDEKLEALKGAKHEAIEKVELFEKALKSMIGRAAEESKSEIVTTYQELENDILQDKHNADTVDDELQQLEGKLKRSEGNRAQRFVCSKQADKKLKEAERLKVNQDKRSNKDVPLSFTPNQSVMNYVKGLHGIGQVKGLHGIGQVKGLHGIGQVKGLHGIGQVKGLHGIGQVNVSRKKVDMYRIKGHRDIDIRMTGDNEACHSPGCCLTKDNKLIVTDHYNKKLKRINLDTMSVEDYCNRHITFNENGDKMFVGDWNKGLVCFDGAGIYLSTSSDNDLKNVVGVCVDGYGNVFVVGFNSHNVVQYNEDGKKIGVIVQQQDGLFGPISVCFHQELNRLFVTMDSSNVVKMYELE
ncbi:hypothetical protein ACF0H5_023258 [Mactra antiquata]